MFRELFVELSEQAMAIALGFGEAAVLKAQPKPVTPPTGDAALWLFPRDTLAYMFRVQYGISCEVRHAAHLDVIEIVYREGCRHVQRIPLSGSFLALNLTRAGIGSLIDEVDARHNERSCYCVVRQESA